MHLYVYGPKALGRADKLAPRGCEPTGLSNRATLGRAEIAGIRTRTRASANDKPSQYRQLSIRRLPPVLTVNTVYTRVYVEHLRAHRSGSFVGHVHDTDGAG